jgi:hypothetical protein
MTNDTNTNDTNTNTTENDWRTNPLAFCRNTLRGLYESPNLDPLSEDARRSNLGEYVSAILRNFLDTNTSTTTYGTRTATDEVENGTALRECVALCAALRNAFEYREEDAADRFLTFGPIMVPASPAGLSFLRFVKRVSRDIARGGLDRLVSNDSTLGSVLLALRNTMAESAFLRTYHNATSTDPKAEKGLRITLDFDPMVEAHRPNGPTLPSALLSPLEGREINDLESIRQEAGMCHEGTRDFLDRFGISYEEERGECDSCGCEDCGEGEGFSWVQTFELSDRMIRFIDKAGYLDEVRDALGVEMDSDSWSEFLACSDDAEIRETLMPDPKYLDKDKGDAIRYDSTYWRFEPDFGAIDGIEDLESEELIRLLPVLSDVARAYQEANALPPIPGKLVWRMVSTNRADRDHTFAWDPDTGTMTHEPTRSGVRLSIDVRSGLVRLSRCEDPVHVWTRLETGFAMMVPVKEAGDVAATFVPLAQSEVTI